MKIDTTKMQHFWWEDAEGNVLELENDRCPTEEEKTKYPIYHSCFPCRISEEISIYEYESPKGRWQKLLLKLPIVGKRMKAKRHKIFKPLCTFNTTYRAGSDCIVAMVNSGDYTLEQAIWVWTHACERCMNVLCYKYLNGTDGYAEFSDEWKKCNTTCSFCEDIQE
jgi:hypothetical protein